MSLRPNDVLLETLTIQDTEATVVRTVSAFTQLIGCFHKHGVGARRWGKSKGDSASGNKWVIIEDI